MRIAAIPIAGMAAMRMQAPLTEKSNGLYEGPGKLDSGGTWQVTILAKKNGQVVASKQLSVNATGGNSKSNRTQSPGESGERSSTLPGSA